MRRHLGRGSEFYLVAVGCLKFRSLLRLTFVVVGGNPSFVGPSCIAEDLICSKALLSYFGNDVAKRLLPTAYQFTPH